MLFDNAEFDNHQSVTFVHDHESGLRAIHATHCLRHNISCGGVRFKVYGDDSEALADVLHLSRTMTYKSTLAGLRLGGAKTVIIGDPASDKTPALLHAFGRYLQSLQGRYIAAPDVGTDQNDMDELGTVCNPKYISGMSSQGGTTSIATCQTVINGMKGAALAVFGSDDLKGRTIAVQGLGGVGGKVATALAQAGAKLLLADIDHSRASKLAGDLGAELVPVDEILSCQCDILSPNALGHIFDAQTVASLRTRLVCGAANTQLADPGQADHLHREDIVWVPDFVVSCGGIVAAMRMIDYITAGEFEEKIAKVYQTTLDLLTRARSASVSPYAMAESIVDEQLSIEAASDS